MNLAANLKVHPQAVRELISPVLHPDDAELIENQLEKSVDVFARVAMSVITEPGDRLAGALIERLGATQLVGLLVNRASPSDLSIALDEDATFGVSALEEAFNANLGDLWHLALERWIPRLTFNAVQSALLQFKSLSGKLIWPESLYFPQELKVLGWATPHLLWLRGNASVLQFEHSVSIVGSRVATNYGAQVSAELVAAASQNSITTVSGGAFGIDSYVHRASISENTPTVAVLAGGLDNLYPRSNQMLFDRLIDDHAVIAEVSMGVAPAKWRFLQRNRIIAALGQATVVVEAGARSGSINTAKQALELERPVAVVPGSIFWSTSAGCHRLLNEHPGEVQVIGSANDLRGLVQSESGSFELVESLGVLETRALDSFSTRAISFMDVQRIAGLTTVETQVALGSLELSGHIQRHPKGFIKVRHTL